jgi:hypothetical protein
MASIEVYTFEDKDGAEQGYVTQDIEEARRYARRYQLRLIANEYEWSDSELVEDHTGADNEDNLS